MKYKNSILISSWQDLIYSIYLIKVKRFKKLNLIFFDSEIYKFCKTKLRFKIDIEFILIKIPYFNIQLRPKNIIKILIYPFQLYLFRKQLRRKFLFSDKIIYTFGSNMAFENAIFFKYTNFNKIFSYDIMQLKNHLSKKKNSKHSLFLNQFSIKRLKFIYHFLFWNFISGNNYRFWYDGDLYKYFKIKNFKNEKYLSSKIFKNKDFSSVIFNSFSKKNKKKCLVFLVDNQISSIKNLETFFKIILNISNYKKFEIYFKFHPYTPSLLEKKLKKNIFTFCKKNLIKKIFLIKKNIPLELINFIPSYFIGYGSGAFRFLMPSKKNIIIVPKEGDIMLNNYNKIYYNYGVKIKLVSEKNISRLKIN